jgi:hypothetical protein
MIKMLGTEHVQQLADMEQHEAGDLHKLCAQAQQRGSKSIYTCNGSDFFQVTNYDVGALSMNDEPSLPGRSIKSSRKRSIEEELFVPRKQVRIQSTIMDTDDTN